MGCFLVPGALAIATTAFRRKISAGYHIDWLNMMLWGSTLGLALEHVANNEVVASPPFLTALTSGAGVASMLREMATLGIAVVIVSVAVWAAAVAIYNRRSQDSAKTAKITQAT